MPDFLAMSWEDKAAQLVMIDISGPQLSPAEVEHLRSHPWSGVLIFARNIASRPQLQGLLREMTEISPGVPLFTVDQEGGLVDAVRFPDTVLSPGGMALAASGEPQCARTAHRILGRQLRDLGFHLDFAPVLDVNNNPDNPIIGVRSFGDDPGRVCEFGTAAILGLQEGGVAATAKHFPGHGDSAVDSHIALPSIPHSRERLEAVELVPFRAAIAAGVDAIMTAHITFPALDPRPGLPATLSQPILTELLRQEMGFEGVIFTDAVTMRAVADHFGVEEASVRAIEAGADVILVCGSMEEHLRAAAAIAGAVTSGRLPGLLVDQALGRISRLKQRWCRPQDTQSGDEDRADMMRQVVRRTITVVRDGGLLPLGGDDSTSVLVVCPDLLPLTPLGEMGRSELALSHLKLAGLPVEEARYPSLPEGPAIGYLCDKSREHSHVLLMLYARDRLSDCVRAMVDRLLESNPRTIVVSLSSPYILRDVPQAPAYVLTYNYSPLSLQALGEVLCGTIPARGRLPVSLPGFYPAGHGWSASL